MYQWECNCCDHHVDNHHHADHHSDYHHNADHHSSSADHHASVRPGWGGQWEHRLWSKSFCHHYLCSHHDNQPHDGNDTKKNDQDAKIF